MADHLQPGGDLLQDLGRGLAEFDQAARIAVTAAAGDLWLVHHHLTRQMRRQWLAAGGFARRLRCGRRLRSGGNLLAKILLEVLQPQLQLSDRALELFRGVAVALPAQHRQLHLDLFNLKQRRLQSSFRLCQFGQPSVTLRQLAPKHRNFRLQRRDIRHVTSLSDRRRPYNRDLAD